MSLSLTCVCGAKLEIDDKFAGKVITCPDCHKELSTAPAPVTAARISAFAIASLVLALIGPLTLIAPLLAVVCGLIGFWHIKRYPADVGGKRLAWAGIALGGLFTGLSVAAYLLPEVLRLDGIFREIEWARKLEFSKELQIEGGDDPKVAISRVRPGWGKMTQRLDAKLAGHAADLMLVDAWNDAYVVCLKLDYDREEDHEDANTLLSRGRSHFLNSAFMLSLGGAGEVVDKDEDGKPVHHERDKKTLDADAKAPGTHVYEMVIEPKMKSGPPRTFLLRVIRIDGQRKLFIVAGGTRSSRFERMEQELRDIVASYKVGGGG